MHVRCETFRLNVISCSNEHEVIGTGRLVNAAVLKEVREYCRFRCFANESIRELKIKGKFIIAADLYRLIYSSYSLFPTSKSK